jgi:diguanylate cyclase (GGDEF)-like protein
MKRPFQVSDSKQMNSLRIFHEVARALTSNLELPAILRTIMSKMVDFFGPDGWSLLMVDQEKGELYYALTAGDDARLRDARIKLGDGVAGRVAQTGEPFIADIRRTEEWKRYAAANPGHHLRSLICMPIREGDQPLGVLQIQNSKLEQLPENAISFLYVLCDYTAIALQNARQMKRIQELTITDDCTGLFNARHLYDMLNLEIGRTSGPRGFSLLFFDLDHFKMVNDTYGHIAGSTLLAEVGALVKRVLGAEHAGFRYGGDEFVALLPGLNRPAALALANTLRDELRRTQFLAAEGRDVHITASFGLACFPDDGDTLQGIIHAADSMMYCAKEEGRDRIVVASGHVARMPPRRHSRHMERPEGPITFIPAGGTSVEGTGV